jgi:AraC-like DNA-binding protein
MSVKFDKLSSDRIRVLDDAQAGIRRMEAFFYGAPFSRHRHDSYAIGATLAGLQCFFYRGSWHRARPGEIHVLFPDEMHDGAAGTEDGFGYRIAYIDPWLLQQALGGRRLPFVRNPVLMSNAAWRSLLRKLWETDIIGDEVSQAEFAVEAVDCLEAAAGSQSANRNSIDMSNLCRVREAIAQNPERRLDATELERLADMDRWSLARGFRAAFGTSPSRFRTMRRLERACARLQTEMTLAEVALDAGFADQSHMNRQFRAAFGMSPRQWKLATLRA